MTMTDLPLLITGERAARELEMSARTVYRMLDAGELRSIKRGRARRVISLSVLEWIAQQEAVQSEEMYGQASQR